MHSFPHEYLKTALIRIRKRSERQDPDNFSSVFPDAGIVRMGITRTCPE